MRGIFSNKFHVERLSTNTCASTHQDEKAETVAMDAQTEARFREYSLKTNIKMGAQALLCWTVMLLGSRSSFYYCSPECYKRQTLHYFVGSGEYFFLFFSFLVSCFSLRRPVMAIYLPVVLLHFLYLLLVNLPPFAYSCKELSELTNCESQAGSMFGLFSPDWNGRLQKTYRFLLTEHRDCMLQGHTSQQMCMTWLLILPRLLPWKKMMQGVWIWIFLFYLPVSIYSLKNAPRWDESYASHGGVGGMWYENHKHDTAVFGKLYFFSARDVIMSVSLLFITNGIAIGKKFYLDKSLRNKFDYDEKMEGASVKMFDILHVMVPVHVIGRMLSNGEVIADPIDRVSILFIMICDFDQHTRTKTPAELLLFLNEQFTSMDQICQLHEVTKIETVGEEYVAAVGVLPDDEAAGKRGHGVILVRLIKAASEILKRQRGDVKFKMGMHTGPVVAGVIGHKLPRFRLFGDTINTAARMMQKCVPGKLQFGDETKEDVVEISSLTGGKDEVTVTSRGQIEMKGKGKVNTFFLDQIKETKKKKATFAMDALEVPSASFSPTKKSSLVNNLLMHHARASAEAESIDVATSTERRGSAGSYQTPSSPNAASSRGSVTEVELTPTTTDASRGRPSSLRSPLLSTDAEAHERRTDPNDGVRPPSVMPPVTWRNAARSPSATTSQHNDEEGGEAVDPKEVSPKAKALASVIKEVRNVELSETKRKKWWYLGIHKQGFTKDMERKWYKWYHESTICKKLDARLDRQAFFMALITLADTFVMMYLGVEFLEGPYRLGPGTRLPTFLVCRTLAFLIVITWRVVATDMQWVEGHPKLVQMRILYSYIFIAALMYASYDAMTQFCSPEELRVGQQGRDMPDRRTSYYSLLFIPIYFTIITFFQLLFLPSCCFILLSFALMSVNFLALCPGLTSGNTLFFSIQGMLLFVVNSAMNAYLAHEAENTSRARFKAKHTMDCTCNRIETILNTLMPPRVVEAIRNTDVNAAPPSHVYNNANIAQSDLCGFTRLAATRTPQEVVRFIGELFGLFDDLTDKYDIYKVETIGDAYIAGQADYPLTEKNRPVSVVLFGLDMVRKTHEWARGMGEEVSCRVGVHSGMCIGGIVGTEMQRYHLFGDLMSGLEVLESTAPEGKVQISKAAKEACELQMRQESLPAEAMTFEPRKEAQLKTSKGEVHEFEEIGGVSFTVRSYAQLRSMIKT